MYIYHICGLGVKADVKDATAPVACGGVETNEYEYIYAYICVCTYSSSDATACNKKAFLCETSLQSRLPWARHTPVFPTRHSVMVFFFLSFFHIRFATVTVQ